MLKMADADATQIALSSYEAHINHYYAEHLRQTGMDILIKNAEGAILTDSLDRKIIDMVAGFGIHNLGHNPPGITDTLCAELKSKPNWNRPFVNDALADLSERLSALTAGSLSRVSLSNSGAEAVDSAIKLARLHMRKPRIIAAKGAFHGFTLGALSASGLPVHRRGFEPLLPEIEHVEFGNMDELERSLDGNTAAVFLEPVQAEIGAIDPYKGYLKEVRELCTRSRVLFILDEVRTGMGRTGQMLACEHEEVIPDILVIGKSLGGGIVPIGALLASDGVAKRAGMSFAMSASSFSGNRLACVAATATLKEFQDKSILDDARYKATRMRSRLDAIQSRMPHTVMKVTGLGLLQGLHFARPLDAASVVREALSNGVLTATAFCNNRCLLLEPPLTIEQHELDQALEVIASASALCEA